MGSVADGVNKVPKRKKPYSPINAKIALKLF